MKKIYEETILFVSISKWFVLASIIGAVVGGATAGFLYLLNSSIVWFGQYKYYYFFLPIALFFSALITLIAPEAKGHGTEKVIEAVHRRSGHIKAVVVPVKLLTTIITLAAGGSVGKEGPCAQIGGGLASIFADIFRFNDSDRKKLVICGISAGFASVFGTPIAGAIFGIEALFVGNFMYDVLLPSFVAGTMGYQVSSTLGITYFYHVLDFVPSFSELFFAKVLLGGIFFGICSLMLIECLKYFERLAKKINIWTPFKGLIGGLILVLLTFVFSTQYLGLGLGAIENTLEGQHVVWWAFAAKILFTSITLSFAGSGGIVTPIFYIGATFGSLYASLMGLDPATFAAIGMVSLLAGAANTPIAASILAVELFGPKVAPYAAVSCVACFFMTGHRSVYPSQILAFMKSSSLQGDIGKEIEDVHTEFLVRQRSVSSLVQYYGRKIIKKL